MKASDTELESLPFLLLNDLFPINNTDKIEELYSRMDRMRTMAAKAQAEVSFKAGIKEVVEWAEANLTYPTRGEGICFERNLEWQSKLKEWGL